MVQRLSSANAIKPHLVRTPVWYRPIVNHHGDTEGTEIWVLSVACVPCGEYYFIAEKLVGCRMQFSTRATIGPFFSVSALALIHSGSA
jgi:hypothetical protein